MCSPRSPTCPRTRWTESLQTLCGSEFLVDEARYPVPEYRFWHPLTQEVAYGSMLGDRRAQIHARVAEAIIDLDPDASQRAGRADREQLRGGGTAARRGNLESPSRRLGAAYRRQRIDPTVAQDDRARR